jgi:hypothetical protein
LRSVFKRCIALVLFAANGGGCVLSGKIFINYRRDDHQGNAGRLYDRRTSYGRGEGVYPPLTLSEDG